ncbi:hypothetical protein Tco_1379009 [Tanacetum coccineum]
MSYFHCLSPKSTYAGTFGTNIASALGGLVHKPKFKFSLDDSNWDVLGHISNGTPFLIVSRDYTLDSILLEVSQLLARGGSTEVLVLNSRAASSGKGCQGIQLKSVLHSQRTASVNVCFFKGYCTSQGTADIQRLLTSKVPRNLMMEVKRLKKQTLFKLNKYQVKEAQEIVKIRSSRTLFKSTMFQEEDTTILSFVDVADQEASNVKSGETEELDLETTQSTARQGTITPRTLNFEDEAGPSSPLRPIQVMDSEEQHNAC